MDTATQPPQQKKEPTNYKKLIIIISVFALLVGFVGWQFLQNSPLNPLAPQQETLADIGPNDPVVRVNGEEIIRTQLDTVYGQIAAQQGVDPVSLNPQAQQQLLSQALNGVVAQAILRQEIEKANVVVPDEDINTQLENIKNQYENEDEFQQALNSQGLTEEGLRAQVSEELQTQSYLSQQLDFDALTASEEEVNAAYTQLEENSEEELPPLEEVRTQLEQSVIQQKQQEAAAGHIQQLQAQADIEVLI